MKKALLYLAVCASFAACSKGAESGDTHTPAPVQGIPFEKGQQFTIKAGAADTTGTGTRVSSSFTGENVSFLWEDNDSIKVTVVDGEGASTTCKLEEGAGTSTGVFTVEMPSAGTLFNVQYPVEDPDITTQGYVANALPRDKMLMVAENCSMANPVFALSAQNAALCLYLWGSGKTVRTLKVQNLTTNNVYTLDCSEEGVVLGDSEASAKSFLLVMPAGEYKFKVTVYETDSKTISTIETLNGPVTFTVGQLTKMAAVKVEDKTYFPGTTTSSFIGETDLF